MTGRKLSVAANGVTLEAAWWGPEPEAAPTLVLLHEGLGCVALWRDFPQRLVDATGCGVFAYSRQGYGQSDAVPVPRPLTYMQDEARDSLPAALDAAGIRRAILVGHSDGASIALLYAGGTQDFRIAGLVLIAPHVLVEDVSIAGIEAARTAYVEADLRARLARYHRDVDGAFWGWNRAWLDPAFRAWRIDDSVAFIRVPILLIQGDGDEYGTVAQLQLIEAEAYCPVDTLLIPGARHAPQNSHAAAVIAAIAAFARRIRAMDGLTSNIMLDASREAAI
jgi:pimeloyl-ACP methyl ester carboxylesterase